MRRTLKIFAIVIAALIVAAIALICGLLAYRAYLQHRNADVLAIHTPRGISEAAYVRIGGIDQWIQIRGQDRRNPVILCLNGGPGASWVPLTLWFAGWEKNFTVVQWDQRGEGKTLETTGLSIADTMSVDRMANDGIEVAEFLRRHLGKPKVILLGHSWGSILGIHMINERPDLFSAYIGTGQVADLTHSLRASYGRTLAEARAAHDERAANDLAKIGPPPYDSAHFSSVAVFFNWLGAYGPESDRAVFTQLGPVILTAPGYSLRDVQYRNAGFTAVPTPKLYQEMFAADLPSYAADFKVPIYFFQGADDNIALASDAKAYFDRIHAPRKKFVLFKKGGHFTVWSMHESFLQQMEALPLR